MYIYKHIKRIIDEADIQGLLKMGAPEHEYDHESKQICYRLNSEDASSLDDIFSVVFWVFLQSFSSVIKFSDGEIKIEESIKTKNAGSLDKIKEIAEKILQTREEWADANFGDVFNELKRRP